MANKYDMSRFESELRTRVLETRKAMAMAVLAAVHSHEEDGELWELVEEMCLIDEGLVAKLEFVIASVFIEKGLIKKEGEHHAH